MSDEYPTKTCDYCRAKGMAYTFQNGETVCPACLGSISTNPQNMRKEIFTLRAQLDTARADGFREGMVAAAGIATDTQGTVSQYPTVKDCAMFNEGCRHSAAAILASASEPAKVGEVCDAGTVEQLTVCRHIIASMLDSLPHNKDWLDPDIERAARVVLAIGKSISVREG